MKPLSVSEKPGYGISHPASALRWGVGEMQGWRPTMEDAHVAMGSLSEGKDSWADTGLFAVFDGHGGEEAAKFCAKRLPKAIRRGGAASNAPAALHSSFVSLDEKMENVAEKIANNQRCFGTIGCTAVACLIDHDSIIVANAGDSRAVLCCGVEAIELSQDHKPGLASESARIEECGGFVRKAHTDLAGRHHVARVNGTLAVSRAMGDLQFKKNKGAGADKQIVSCVPDVTVCNRQPHDEFLVIACDGVWDVLSSQEVVKRVRKHLPAIHRGDLQPADVVYKIFDKCLASHPSKITGTDNMTMIIVVFHDTGLIKPSASKKRRRGFLSFLGF